jgi:hypothetical protein
VLVSGKNITGWSPRISEHGLIESRISGQEIEVNEMEEGEINDVDGDEVVFEDMGYTKVNNIVTKLEKRVARETGPDLSQMRS